ncbi:NAD(P)H-dependent oxidoreductase [Paraburkholderia phymatum]|uniref:NAD(P)H-dependent oxidoreductase n=1 Tax=Paraburkholderia phymatum TaxID=148447 RepID=UPI00316E4824
MSKKTLVILAHPDLAGSQINAAWRARLEEAATSVVIRNIYELYPDWNIDVAAEQALLESHERIFLQFPLYWYSTPPLLKKWLDDVLAYGWAYGPGGNLLAHKEIGLVVSTGSPEAAYRADGRLGHTLAELLRPLEQTARFVGARYLPVFALQGANHIIPAEQLRRNANDYVEHIAAPHDKPR